MNLEAELLREHSKRQCTKIVKYVGDNTARFAQLVKLFLQGPYRITQRAAWPVSYCVEAHPTLVNKHLNALLTAAAKKDAPEAVKRNVMRLLQYIEIPKRLQGRTADLCYRFLSSPEEAIAVRVFAMTVMANLSATFPELARELVIILEDALPYGSPGFVSRARKVLKKIKG